MAEFIELPHGCYCSQISVSPKNWKDKGASIKKDWYVFYRFHDPSTNEPPKLVLRRNMNSYKTLTGRRKVTDEIIKNELSMLIDNGYNPFSKKFDSPLAEQDIPDDSVVHEKMPFRIAMKLALKTLKVADTTGDDLKNVVDRIILEGQNVFVNRQKVLDLPLCEIKKKHLKPILEKCAIKIKDGQYSEYQFNKHRTYLMIVFSEFLEVDAVEFNVPEGLKRKSTIKRMRTVLTDDQRIQIDIHLRTNYYSFWRFMHIFYQSGAREREIMDVKTEDVDLPNQRVKYLIMKGGQYREEYRAIKNSVFSFWKCLYEKAKPGEYIFSEKLEPGYNRIRTDQITKRWYRLVKTKLGIDADFYSLKHLHSDEMLQELGEGLTAGHNQHTVGVLLSNYAHGHKARGNEKVKKSAVGFLPVVKTKTPQS